MLELRCLNIIGNMDENRDQFFTKNVFEFYFSLIKENILLCVLLFHFPKVVALSEYILG